MSVVVDIKNNVFYIKDFNSNLSNLPKYGALSSFVERARGEGKRENRL